MRHIPAIALVTIVVLNGCTSASGTVSQQGTSAAKVTEDKFEGVVTIRSPSVSSGIVDRRAFFLRTFVYNGKLTAAVGGIPAPKSHQMYVENTYGSKDWRLWVRAAAPQHPLEFTSIDRDVLSCTGTGGCRYSEVFGAEIPDSLLRSSRDSLPVKFYARSGDEMILVLRREQISAQLAAVDSVRGVKQVP